MVFNKILLKIILLSKNPYGTTLKENSQKYHHSEKINKKNKKKTLIPYLSSPPFLQDTSFQILEKIHTFPNPTPRNNNIYSETSLTHWVAKTHHAETQFIVETKRNPIQRQKPKKPSSLELPHVDADHRHLMPLINPPSKTQNFSNANITTIFNQTIKTHHPSDEVNDTPHSTMVKRQ